MNAEPLTKLTDTVQRVREAVSAADDRKAVDLKVLRDNVKRVGHLRHDRTRLNTDYMGEVSVELSETVSAAVCDCAGSAPSSLSTTCSMNACRRCRSAAT